MFPNLFCLMAVKRKSNNQSLSFTGTKSSFEGNQLAENNGHPDILVFDLCCIVAATDNFSPTNKLGEGGFGSVFKVKSQFSTFLFLFMFHIPVL
jgi:hypothetical protein